MTCPHCGSDGKGEPIPAEHRQHKPDHDEQLQRYNGRCYCLPYGEKTHFSRFIGHEVWGVYDGILFWVCPDCGLARSRFVIGEGADHLAVAGAQYVADYNAQVTA